jgi:hypothetical protein
MADNSKAVVVEATKPVLNETQQRIEDARDKANWEWITVPEHNLFGQVHDGVSLNFVK